MCLPKGNVITYSYIQYGFHNHLIDIVNEQDGITINNHQYKKPIPTGLQNYYIFLHTIVKTITLTTNFRTGNGDNWVIIHSK